MTKNESYNGNGNLVKPTALHNFTKDEISEFIKCRNDPVYFTKNYVHIISLDHGKILFNLYPFQEEIVNTIFENRQVIISTGRQQGKTQVMASILLHYVLFNKDKTCAVLANKAATSREILARIQFSLEQLPAFLKPGIETYNKGSFELSNGSSIIASATSSSSIRGLSINFLYLDEFAHLSNDPAEFYESTVPVISSGKTSKMVITSTPKGLDFFHSLYKKALDPKSPMCALAYTWRDVPNRVDSGWEEDMRATMTPEQFDQEFEGNFLGSSNTLISSIALKNIVPMYPIKLSENISYYRMPEQGRKYVMTVDTGRGRGLDYSVATVFDVTAYPIEQVAVFRDNEISPMIYPNILAYLGNQYNEAGILVETNDIGEAIVNALNYDLEYENIISEKTTTRKYQIGVRTTKLTKRLGCATLKSLLESQKLIINDENTRHELANFIAKGSSYEADKGSHDDCVMTLVMLAWYTNTDNYSEDTNTNIKDELFSSRISQMEEAICPAGFVNDGMDEEIISYEGGERWSI